MRAAILFACSTPHRLEREAAIDTPHKIRLEEIFERAAALHAAERAAWLDEACAGQPELRVEVEELLRSHEAGSFMGPRVQAELARLKPEEAGERIGNYKLLEQIGEGGFGVVWVAEQGKPVRRRVALKIIKLGMNTKEVVARFEQERQALAMMDHPNIAKVFDAGATPFGRPFFVMELVRGIKITDYCDQANLSTGDRLELFITVCQAVQHAHQKGIIHRDLKPSNILVTLQDGVPVPKVIDFGVAKATQQQRLTDLTVYTQFEQMVGTPLYMSPEQAEMSGLDIDTRSDIYSLGVLLYELLAGRTPFDPQELMRQALDTIRRTIREQEPQKPSAALSTMAAEAQKTVAQHRHSDAAKLISLIRGDLDWIVMKALEKDRTRRYETASGLAVDIQRHLQSEPILARPPSFTYRAGKFVRKHKGPVTAAAAVLVVLLGGLTASTVLYLREKAAWASEAAQRKTADEQRKLAEERLTEVSYIQVLLGKGLRAKEASMLSKGADTSYDTSKAVAEFQAKVAALQTAVDRGSAPAAASLGECYLRGKGVAYDPARGVELIRRASDAGYPYAMDLLGFCYYRGIGVRRDLKKAAGLFSNACGLGHMQSLGSLAILFLNGQGVEQDTNTALKLILKGIEANNPRCMYLYAHCLEEGIGLPRNPSEAKKWYGKAAEIDNELAQEWLALNDVWKPPQP